MRPTDASLTPVRIGRAGTPIDLQPPGIAEALYARILTSELDAKENWPGLVALTSIFSVELPGIEPGSYGIPSRLLRAQFAKSLLGSLGHANKPR
jgi:hypothetical protein